MKEIHILVTGVGRRVELMQAFRQAALNLNINLKLYGADMAGTAPALVYCDYTRKVNGNCSQLVLWVLLLRKMFIRL